MNKYKLYGIGNALLDYEYKINDQILEDLNLEKGCMLLNEYEKHTIFTTLTDIKEKDNDVNTVEDGEEEYILKTFTETYEYGKLWKNIGKSVDASKKKIDISSITDDVIKKKNSK